MTEDGINLKMLHRLAAERPQQTPEELKLNDFYGHADLLKRYAGVPRNSALRVVIEHGSRLGGTNWDAEVDAPYFIYSTWSPRRFDAIQRHAPKACFALGPIIEYVPPVRAEQLTKLVASYGRNLLFFPSHSTHWVDANHNVDSVCEKLKELKNQFDTIRICMYWRDIQRNIHTLYLKHGFLVQCAGHIYDKQFYTRLRELIEPATVTASMVPGSCIGHSLSLGKPYWHLAEPVQFVSEHDREFSKIDPAIQQRDITKDIENIFGTRSEAITLAQRDFATKAFGMGQRKSPRAVRLILDLGNEIWSLTNNPGGHEERLLASMLLAKSMEQLYLNDHVTALKYAENAAPNAPDYAARVFEHIQENSITKQKPTHTSCRASR